ncbi:MAG: RHS repeat-associated core domain-containing protein, partial [Sphingobacteriaceae bacterium]|nr:RHS repeat-associated core domain-containing protein [Sphingobacteriaceae bacterium]
AGVRDATEANIFFYHSDHLGSSSFLTDGGGIATQHLQYMPFGEDLVHQQNTAAYYTPYTFSGKERDMETGLSYFGARYYDAGLSIWLSVDPMSDKYPSLSAYNYCAWNPVMLVDPDGRDIIIVGDENYQKKVLSILDNIKNSGAAGRFLVNYATNSKKSFVIVDVKSSVKSELSENPGKNASVLPFNLSSNSGTFDEANGGVEHSPETNLAHELAHFAFPRKGNLLNESGQNSGVRAGEVTAVEWENRVRSDMGMNQRTSYGGIKVGGMGLSNSQYEGFFNLKLNPNYGKSTIPQTANRMPTRSLELRQSFLIDGKYFDSKLTNPSYRQQMRIK